MRTLNKWGHAHRRDNLLARIGIEICQHKTPDGREQSFIKFVQGKETKELYFDRPTAERVRLNRDNPGLSQKDVNYLSVPALIDIINQIIIWGVKL